MGLATHKASWFEDVTCYNCATVFCLSSVLYEKRKADHLSFWCPNGHEQHFAGESADKKRVRELEVEVQRRREETERANRARTWAEQQAKGANISAGIAKSKLRRTIERVHAGVCPHCHRTFKQLAAHMQSKHADVTS